MERGASDDAIFFSFRMTPAADRLRSKGRISASTRTIVGACRLTIKYWPGQAGPRREGISPPHEGRSGLCLLDELDGVADSQDRVSCVVGNFDAEFFFESHDQFNGIERISAQIVNEAGAFNNLVGVNAKMINYNFLYAFCDIAHVGFLDLYFEGNASRHPALLEPSCAVQIRHCGQTRSTRSKLDIVTQNRNGFLSLRDDCSQSWPA
ncbi:Acyl carrier protein (modular protein) [Agrobacterium genomosp. 13 str. CFBP 6927]|uniref:Acyl carrier protein (Modular protein) n=1 Tax=Agrobacterium genomosp. 13 str. CFBP 6927 TaxID=1183428 RepID=A0ABP2BBL2_9HYPH|nr:Acyl carrier protein (modular protein) [Agrobacterium genomosp. 13 str. CFBP 6927]